MIRRNCERSTDDTLAHSVHRVKFPNLDHRDGVKCIYLVPGGRYIIALGTRDLDLWELPRPGHLPDGAGNVVQPRKVASQREGEILGLHGIGMRGDKIIVSLQVAHPSLAAAERYYLFVDFQYFAKADLVLSYCCRIHLNVPYLTFKIFEMKVIGASMGHPGLQSHRAIVHIIYMDSQSIPPTFTRWMLAPSLVTENWAVFLLGKVGSAIVWDYTNGTYCHVRPRSKAFRAAMHGRRVEVSHGMYQMKEIEFHGLVGLHSGTHPHLLHLRDGGWSYSFE